MTITDSLKIPYGKDESGTLVRAADALRGATYRCPSCSTRLSLKAGVRRQAHFAHCASTACASEETLVHLIAKRLVAAAIDRNARGEGPEQVLVVPCSECASPVDKCLPGGVFTTSGIEVPIGDYRVDVVGFQGDAPRLAFEVLATHAVPETKASTLSVPWVELSAAEIIADPRRWTAARSRLQPTYCQACLVRFQEIHKAAKRCGIPTECYSVSYHARQAPYVAGVETCWRCGHAIAVFWWDGVPFCDRAPPEPRPRTVQWRYSKTYGGHYWANTCPCGAVQGDNFLFLEPTGPLSHLPRNHDRPFVEVHANPDSAAIVRRLLPYR